MDISKIIRMCILLVTVACQIMTVIGLYRKWPSQVICVVSFVGSLSVFVPTLLDRGDATFDNIIIGYSIILGSICGYHFSRLNIPINDKK